MQQFALLLNHAPDRYQGLSEDQYMAIIKDYVAWVEDMTAKGTYLGGHKLSEMPGRTLSSDSGSVEVHESPFAELSEVLGGIMVIQAEDFDDAVRIAKDHPHMRHNTSMEIKQLEDVD